jgi:hypothetical protein
LFVASEEIKRHAGRVRPDAHLFKHYEKVARQWYGSLGSSCFRRLFRRITKKKSEKGLIHSF